MDNFAKDSISLLQYLLPGLVAAWIFYGLTSYPKPSQFERIIQALIFTFFIQALVSIIKKLLNFIGHYWAIAEWNGESDVIWSTIFSILIGIQFSKLANNNKLHEYLVGKGITKETSFPSEWFSAFGQNITFVVLHFKDERRLYGWPIEWPSEPTKGHFLIEDPSWIADDREELRIEGVKNILVDVNEVKWVEFLDRTWEKDNGKENIKSTSTKTPS